MMMARLYAGLSFDAVVQKYAQNVYTACLMRLSGNADVDDCVQNTFVSLYRNAPEFENENHLKAWLLRVAINECRKSARRNKRLVPLDVLSGYPHAQSESDDHRDMSWALMRLPPKYREPLYLYYAEGYKVNEIAAILGSRPGTVKSLLFRGREKLKKIYGGDEE